MNMPFEFGVGVGFRRSAMSQLKYKRFLVFENGPYDLKSALSDTAGQDVEFHRCDYALIMRIPGEVARESGVISPTIPI